MPCTSLSGPIGSDPLKKMSSSTVERIFRLLTGVPRRLWIGLDVHRTGTRGRRSHSPGPVRGYMVGVVVSPVVAMIVVNDGSVMVVSEVALVVLSVVLSVVMG